MQVKELKKGEKVLLQNCKVAESFTTRLMGLMGRKSLAVTEGVAFPKCNSIHTFFMFMPIDVLFVSSEGRVVSIFESLLPWKFVFPQKGAKHTVEMQAKSASRLGIQIGDELQLEGVF